MMHMNFIGNLQNILHHKKVGMISKTSAYLCNSVFPFVGTRFIQICKITAKFLCISQNFEFI
jgi:hypothetical protein